MLERELMFREVLFYDMTHVCDSKRELLMIITLLFVITTNVLGAFIVLHALYSSLELIFRVFFNRTFLNYFVQTCQTVHFMIFSGEIILINLYRRILN